MIKNPHGLLLTTRKRFFSDISHILAIIVYFLGFTAIIVCNAYAVEQNQVDPQYLALNIVAYGIIPVWCLFSLTLKKMLSAHQILLNIWSVGVWIVFGLGCIFLLLVTVPILLTQFTSAFDPWTYWLGVFEIVVLFQQLHLLTEVKTSLLKYACFCSLKLSLFIN